MKHNIRIAKPEDFTIIQKLCDELYKDNESFDQHLDTNWSFSKNGIDYFKKVLSAKDHCCLLAEIDGRPAGFLLGGPKKLDYRIVSMAEIQNIGVSRDYRSLGIGTSLISRFRQWSREHGYQQIYVAAYYLNTRAVVFYKRQGLTPLDLSLEMDL